MELILIAAMAAHRVMGRKRTLPWHIPEDLAHFQKVTMGHCLIMGRRTWESIGASLPGRRILVLSATPGLQPGAGCSVHLNLDAALAACAGETKVFLAGGERVFREGMALAHTILLSVIDLEFEGDVYFPEIPMDQFRLTETRPLANNPPVRLETYRRIAESGRNGRDA